AAETYSTETVSDQTFSQEPIAEPVYAAELSVEPDTLEPETIDQQFDAPPEPAAPRRREPTAPVFIDATAAAASVSEAIAQIEGYVARESLASETVAKLEASEFSETTWETASNSWDTVDRGADEDTTGETPVSEGIIELDLSTLLEEPQVD